MSILTKLNGIPLHPGRSESDPYALNPLEYIAHTSPTYSIDVLSSQAPNNTITTVYPGTVATGLRALVKLANETDGQRYIHSIMDIEKIEFKITRAGQNNWENIQGPTTDRIQYAGKVTTTTIKPSNLRTQGDGSWILTGVKPYAYYDHNYDEFFFADFYARIHKNDPMNGTALFATFPWDARYQDGNYEVKAAITNVNEFTPSNNNLSAGNSFKIDNFKPFVRAVRVNCENYLGGVSTQIYHREWSKKNAPTGKLRLQGASCKNPFSIDDQKVTVFAITSESMLNMKAYIGTISDWVQGSAVTYTPSDPESEANQKWAFQFEHVNFTEGNCYEIGFEGEDLNGNKILFLPQPANCHGGENISFTVPYRTSANTWLSDPPNTPGEGSDKVHKFKVGKCGGFVQSNQAEYIGPPCITSNEVEYKIYSSAPEGHTGSIDMIIAGGNDGLSFTWTNAAGEEVGYSERLSGLAPGVYCIEVKNECCAFSDCIEVKACDLYIVSSATLSSRYEPTGWLALYITNGMDPYQIQWSNGSTVNPLTNVAAGDYGFTVTDAYNCSREGSASVPSCPIIQMAVTAKVYAACSNNNGYIKIFNVSSSGGATPYAYSWYDTYGEPIDDPYDLASGTYCLVATDANGCTGIKCFNVGTTLSPMGVYAKEIKNVSSCHAEDGKLWNACDGAISIGIDDYTISGDGPFNVTWSGPDGFTAVGESISDLCVGSYTVTIENAAGCSTSKVFNICCCKDNSKEGSSFPGACAKGDISIDEQKTKVNALTPQNNYSGNISLSISPNNGESLYYYWNGPNGFTAYTKNIDNLLFPGNYCVTITDGCSNEKMQCFNLGNCAPGEIPSMAVKSSPSCEGGHSGQIDITTNYGYAPYSLYWGDGSIGNLAQNQLYTIQGLAEGTYTVTVTDAGYCTATTTVSITTAIGGGYVFPLSYFSSSISGAGVPFEAKDPCSNHPLGNSKIILKKNDCLGIFGEDPPNPPIPASGYPYNLGIDWNRGSSYSTVYIQEDGDCYASGPDDYDVNDPGIYYCGLFDQYGCKKEWCFEFGDETIIHYSKSDKVEPLGGGAMFEAVVGCVGCKNCGPLNCSDSDVADCWTGFKHFVYKPSDPANPCGGEGSIEVPCDGSVISLPASGGVEYIDWASGDPANGDCTYQVGCLFLGLDNPYFQGQPVYVTTTITITNPICDQPTTTPGNPYLFCLGGVDYIIGNDEECTGKIICRLTGEVIFEGILEEFTRTCFVHYPLYCDKVTYCTLSDEIIETEYDVECPPDCNTNPVYCEPCFAASPGAVDRNSNDNTAIEEETLKMRAYPNPFDQFLMIEFDSKDEEEGSVQILISDVVGRVQWERNTLIHLGKNRFPISASEGFAPGIYYVSVKDSKGNLTTTKVVRIGK